MQLHRLRSVFAGVNAVQQCAKGFIFISYRPPGATDRVGWSIREYSSSSVVRLVTFYARDDVVTSRAVQNNVAGGEQSLCLDL